MSWRTGIAAVMAPLALIGCASTPQEGFDPIARAEAPYFDPMVFFLGESVGRGELSKLLSGTVPVRVESAGRMLRPGVLELVQVVTEGDKAPRTRRWEIRKAGEGRWEGTLTDADGLVELYAKGNLLTIQYRMDGNYDVTQRLTLAPDGRSAYNELKVELLGATVAVLAEEIVKTS
ncbi:Protein of unknown function (DUF3833) [Erythrobacter litoralis]|jgi:hypothetical protein|uniref:Lipoprotein n=1 Tax=Erythrobacter litoralis TaxID=39960 RepID=A0A074M5E9_9SPHN|nr:DUF3833 family protein [Erythrobacter litoralis]AOL22698.1 Protein of unknown function (DUF3833) [Erythrobacter litoralis]KEO89936.1 hypothetical protein EH32_02815 [Erythrobacter litoralis]MEE4338252.1 DUF3833 family protein [Erythrobacter sp.]